ncbi:MAG: polysaccharide biosynthesis tyrosine autokinase [Xanthobacteraceae bacterium]
MLRSDRVSELLEQCAGFLRRQYLVFVVVVLGSVSLGLAYLFVTPPQYTAKAMVLIDSSKVRVLQPQQQALGDAPLDTAQVETQVEILKSERFAVSVVKELRLTEDQEFVGSEAGPVGALLSHMGFAKAANRSEAEKIRAAARVFLGRRSITRVGRTYAIDIGFTSLSPDRAAAIANGIAQAYILDQLQSKYQTTRLASDWLQDRIKELQTQALAADRAVIEYKEKNNIVAMGGDGGVAGSAGSGRLIGEQQLAELNTQLINARVATGEAKARLQRIDDVLKQGSPDGATADSLHNDVINRMRNQYFDLAAREADWTRRYGADHQAVVRVHDQMDELRRSIREELGRIAASYNSDYEIAKAREESLERKVASLVTEGQVTNRDRLGLNELESNAKANHAIYDTFLQRYTEAIQQESFPITEARLVSPAQPPEQKSSPIGSIVLAVSGLLGVVLAFGIGAVRESLDFVFRTSRQVEDGLRTSCLAVLPLVKQTPSTSAANGADKKAVQHKGQPESDARSGHGRRLVARGVPQDRVVLLTDALMRQVVEEPFSPLAEGFRAIKIAAELHAAVEKNKVIGITSAQPGEGKSTVACNLAELMADAGKRVILIDADLRKPRLIGCLEPKPSAGLLELLGGAADLQQVVRFDAETGLAILPAVVDAQLAHTDEVVSSDAFKRLIEQLREHYDYIIVDLPPLGPVVDVRAATQSVDSFIFVVEWGHSRINVVQRCLDSAPEVHHRLLGVVLNKADAKVLPRYDLSYGSFYRNQSYGQYGHQ